MKARNFFAPVILPSLFLVLTACNGGSSSPNNVDPNAGNVMPNVPIPSATPVNLTVSAIKSFNFTWTDIADASYYRIMENADGASGFSQVGADIASGVESYTHSVPLYNRINAQYILESCSTSGCSSSTAVNVGTTFNDGIGYVKASTPGANDEFGKTVQLSADGLTMAVGVQSEDSNATGVNGDETNNNAVDSGAVYMFEQTNGIWVQTAYLKASNTSSGDAFGEKISLSDDGNTLAVGASGEDTLAAGVNSGTDNNFGSSSGAVYLFEKVAGVWAETNFIKASNTQQSDSFGASVSLNSDGTVLAIGADAEYSNATGINGNQLSNSSPASGAVYVFVKTNNAWAQTTYIKASNTGVTDLFGYSLSLSDDGNTLAVGALQEQSNGSSQNDNSANVAGAVYVFTNNNNVWAQTAYLKASNAELGDRFGWDLSMSGDGNTLAIAAQYENSGIATDPTDNGNSNAGAVYVFEFVNSVWSETAYLKASNLSNFTGWNFGDSVSINTDGSIIVVGATGDYSNGTGINADETNTSANSAGSAFVFQKQAGVFSQTNYLKAPNAETIDQFGIGVAVSGDGDTIAVGAYWESSNAIGINGDMTDNSTDKAGAVYLF